MKIDLIQEICCDLCNDGIHVHMKKCPCCKKEYAGTDIYGNAHDKWVKDEIPSFSCEECNTKFTASKEFGLIQMHEGIFYTDWEIVK